MATLDGSPCSRCIARDLKVFPLADYAIGVTAPPLHPFCRCTTVPYFKDEFSAGGQRAARNEKDKVYYIPEDMTYGEWKKAFVDGKKENLTALKIPEFSGQKMQQSYQSFLDMLDHSEGNEGVIQRLRLYGETTDFVVNTDLDVAFAYNFGEDNIQYNPKSEKFGLYNMNYVQVHELSHRMDILEYHSWENGKFVDAVDICRKKLYTMFEESGDEFSDFLEKYADNPSVSDIISALSEGEFNEWTSYKHDKKYWKAYDGLMVYLEVFANVVSIDIEGDRTVFSGLLEELYEAYKDVVS